MNRREFLARSMAGTLSVVATRAAGAQEATNFAPMEQNAYRQVRRPPKPGATTLLDAEARDALERRMRCQCGCTLDVYTCRTTDFTCQVSPAMHRDVLSLIEGGYSADEIIAAFEETYGERVLMAPKREGFNWVAWIMPFAALGGGAAVVTAIVRRWGAAERASPAAATARPVDATDEELARLEAAVRDDR